MAIQHTKGQGRQMKLYRAECKDLAPVLVECPDNCRDMLSQNDADGRTIYDNSHFDTEADAWGSLMSDAEAWVSMSGRDIKADKIRLAKAREVAGDAAERFVDVKRGMDGFLREIKEK